MIMKKKLMSLLLATACVAMMCGCGDDPRTGIKHSGSNASESSEGVDENGKYQYDPENYVTLAQYKGAEISIPAKVEYEEDEYEVEAVSYYFNYITEESGITDRPVELYDMTNINYVGKKDGVAFDGGTAEGASLLIGSGSFIDGFEEGLIGVMPGETVDLNLKFPDAYHSAELAGQEVVFTVTVNFIAEMKDERVPELGVAGVNTVEEMKQYVRKSMDDYAETEYITQAGSAVFDKVLAESEYKEFPEGLLEENRKIYENYLNNMASIYGMDVYTYASNFSGGLSYDEFVEQQAIDFTKEMVVVKAIAQKENLTLSEEELDARLETYAAAAGMTVEKLLESGATKADYGDSFMYEDVLTLLAENAVNTPLE